MTTAATSPALSASAPAAAPAEMYQHASLYDNEATVAPHLTNGNNARPSTHTHRLSSHTNSFQRSLQQHFADPLQQDVSATAATALNGNTTPTSRGEAHKPDAIASDEQIIDSYNIIDTNDLPETRPSTGSVHHRQLPHALQQQQQPPTSGLMTYDSSPSKSLRAPSQRNRQQRVPSFGDVDEPQIIEKPAVKVQRRYKTKHRKINKTHPEFELTYDMMLGIRTTVGRAEAKPIPTELQLSNLLQVKDKYTKSHTLHVKDGKVIVNNSEDEGDSDSDEETEHDEGLKKKASNDKPSFFAFRRRLKERQLMKQQQMNAAHNNTASANATGNADQPSPTNTADKPQNNDDDSNLPYKPKVKKQNLTQQFQQQSLSLRFPGRGSNLTPAHNMRDFKFKDYAPHIFRLIRSTFHLAPDDYLMNICGNFQYLEFISNSKSGAFFFYSHDRRFMIKTISKDESKFLRSILPAYIQYITRNPQTLLTRFYGMHRVKPHKKPLRRFLIMQSVFYTRTAHRYVHITYDLKGSHYGRAATEKEKQSSSAPVFKDCDFEDAGTNIKLGEPRAKELKQQLARDAQFLASLGIMDYSLLLGIHYKNREAADEQMDAMTEDERGTDNENSKIEYASDRMPHQPQPARNASNGRQPIERQQSIPATPIASMHGARATSSPSFDNSKRPVSSDHTPRLQAATNSLSIRTNDDTSAVAATSQLQGLRVNAHTDSISPIHSAVTLHSRPSYPNNSQLPSHHQRNGSLVSSAGASTVADAAAACSNHLATPRSQNSITHTPVVQKTTAFDPAAFTGLAPSALLSNTSPSQNVQRVSSFGGNGFTNNPSNTTGPLSSTNAQHRQSAYGLPKRYDKVMKPSDINFLAPDFPLLDVDAANNAQSTGPLSSTHASAVKRRQSSVNDYDAQAFMMTSPTTIYSAMHNRNSSTPSHYLHQRQHSAQQQLQQQQLNTYASVPMMTQQPAARNPSDDAPSPPLHVRQVSTSLNKPSITTHAEAEASVLNGTTTSQLPIVHDLPLNAPVTPYKSSNADAAPDSTDSVNQQLQPQLQQWPTSTDSHHNAVLSASDNKLATNNDTSTAVSDPVATADPPQADSEFSEIWSVDGSECYYMGIIDVLTIYNLKKRMEHLGKSLTMSKQNRHEISAVPPDEYANRFVQFVGKHIR